MKIIEPSVGLWKQGDDVKAHVAKCARVCYGKETGNDDVTINTLLKKHHWSMFRHESVYVIGEFTSRLSIALTRYDNNPYIDWTFHNNKLYIVTNGNFILDLKEQQEVNAHAQVLLTYITTLVHDCLLSDLTNVFDYNLLKYIKKPNFATNTIDYIISANIDIADEVEEQIQQLLQYDNYKDIYYVRNNNKFNFYLKTYSND